MKDLLYADVLIFGATMPSVYGNVNDSDGGWSHQEGSSTINAAAYDFKSITFCNLNTAGVDTYNDLPNDGSQYYYTFNLINTARDNGDYATCMSLDATIYNSVNVSNAPGQISGASKS